MPFDYFCDQFSPYFPGMRVTGIGDTWKTAEWCKGEYSDQSRCKGVVSDVAVMAIEVEWFASISDPTDPSLPKVSSHTLDQLRM